MFLLCHPLDFRYYYLDKLVRTKYFLQQFYISPKDTDWARCFAFCCCYCCFCYFYYHWYYCCWCYCYWDEGLEHSLLLPQLPLSVQLLLLDTSHWGRKVSKTPRVGGRHQRIYYCDILSHIPYTLGLFPYLLSFIHYPLSLYLLYIIPYQQELHKLALRNLFEKFHVPRYTGGRNSSCISDHALALGKLCAKFKVSTRCTGWLRREKGIIHTYITTDMSGS